MRIEFARMGNNDDTFVFAGICANGQAYRLMTYQKNRWIATVLL
jgi:hypothetical protein